MNAIELYLQKSDESFNDAQLLFANQRFQACVSRAYYASYYAVPAILQIKGIDVKTHQGALTMFSKHFIKTGIFSSRLSKFLKESLDQRLIGDYEIGFKVDRESARLTIDYAQEIISTIKNYLENSEMV